MSTYDLNAAVDECLTEAHEHLLSGNLRCASLAYTSAADILTMYGGSKTDAAFLLRLASSTLRLHLSGAPQ